MFTRRSLALAAVALLALVGCAAAATKASSDRTITNKARMFFLFFFERGARSAHALPAGSQHLTFHKRHHHPHPHHAGLL
jgi:hypothetical protein